MPHYNDLLSGPLACKFLLLASGMPHPLAAACDRRIAVNLAAAARAILDPWSGSLEDDLNRALTADMKIVPLAETLARDPRAAWWRDPLTRDMQVLLTGSQEVTQELAEDVAWEAYAQRPLRGYTTSTGPAGLTGHEALLAHQVGDWEPEYPVGRKRVSVTSGARVYEIGSPEDWHRLSIRYQDEGASHRRYRGGTAPSWTHVARDWDGVHLSFWGLLTATYVPVTHDSVTTVLWSWDSEQTVWLHDVLLLEENLSPLSRPPERFAPACSPGS